jgi:hypothetical protein
MDLEMVAVAYVAVMIGISIARGFLTLTVRYDVWRSLALSVPFVIALYIGGFFNEVGVPQFIWAVLYGAGWYVTVNRHGQTEKLSGAGSLIGAGILILLLVWGDFGPFGS